MPEPVTVRPASDADGTALATLIAAVFADYEGCPFIAEEWSELAAVATHFAGRGGRIWVAESAGAVVGCLALAPTHATGVVELFKMYVDRRHRGRGIAAQLLETAFRQARELAARSVILWTDTRFIEGHRFYERHGFTRQPGIRALHDAGRSLEYGYRLDVIPG